MLASKVMEVVPVVAAIAVGGAKVVPERQVEDEAVGPGPRREGQPQGGLLRQEGGVGRTAGRLEGEEGPARAGADRLVGIVEEAALRSASRFNEAELLRGSYFAQMEVTTLAGALLRKAGGGKLKAYEAKAQLAKLKEKSASWESAHTELQTVQAELEDTRRQVAAREFQLAGEQKKFDDAQRACAAAGERHEEAMSNNEELVRQKDEVDSRVGDL